MGLSSPVSPSRPRDADSELAVHHYSLREGRPRQVQSERQISILEICWPDGPEVPVYAATAVVLKIWVIVFASTLPPLRITPTVPWAGTAPLNNAAKPSAPEGSTTSFIR